MGTADPGARVRAFLEARGIGFEVLACDPALADTAVFCDRYGVSLADSANTILVKAKTGGVRYAACVLLADARLDVNHTVRRRLGARRVSFASPEETLALTGMAIGGVTPLALPPELPVWVDARVLGRDRIVLGGGDRASKIRLAARALLEVPGVEVVEGLARAPAGAGPADDQAGRR